MVISLLLINPINTLVIQANGSYDFIKESGLNDTATKAGYSEANKQLTLEHRISKIITGVLILLGVVFLILITYAGIMWMTAFGNEDKAKKATELLTEAVIGLIIVLSAYAISFFIFKYLSTNALTLPTNNQGVTQN